MSNTPRRIRMDLQNEVEEVISKAIEKVENLGADTLLTDAVILLGQAKDKVSDYLEKEGIEPKFAE